MLTYCVYQQKNNNMDLFLCGLYKLLKVYF